MAKLLLILTPVEHGPARAFLVSGMSMDDACDPYDYFGQLTRVCGLDEDERIVCAIPLTDPEALVMRSLITDWRGERVEVLDVKLV